MKRLLFALTLLFGILRPTILLADGSDTVFMPKQSFIISNISREIPLPDVVHEFIAIHAEALNPSIYIARVELSAYRRAYHYTTKTGEAYPIEFEDYETISFEAYDMGISSVLIGYSSNGENAIILLPKITNWWPIWPGSGPKSSDLGDDSFGQDDDCEY